MNAIEIGCVNESNEQIFFIKIVLKNGFLPEITQTNIRCLSLCAAGGILF